MYPSNTNDISVDAINFHQKHYEIITLYRYSTWWT